MGAPKTRRITIIKKKKEYNMERVRHERTPRDKVPKMWRNVSWAESFQDEALSMETTDLTPAFALRKLALFFDNGRFDECAALIRRMNIAILTSILDELPFDVIHESLPDSLTFLEALYVKMYEDCDEFPVDKLNSDTLIKSMLHLFSQQYQSSNRGQKNCNSYVPFCRNILRILGTMQPQLKHKTIQQKRTLDKCLRQLGKHGLVEHGPSGGKLLSLHDALKHELELLINQYKTALQKMEELHLARKLSSSSLTTGPAPTSASHQRLLQMTTSEVQDRIIKNKTVFSIVEPSLTYQNLSNLINILEKRINYDKALLYQDTELRKICSGSISKGSHVSTQLRHYSQAYSFMIQLLKEVTNSEGNESPVGSSQDDSSDENDFMCKPLARSDRLISRSLNGLITRRFYEGGSTYSKYRQVNSLSGRTAASRSINYLTANKSTQNSARISQPITSLHNQYASMNGHTNTRKSSNSNNMSLPFDDSSGASSKISALEREVNCLESELERSQALVKRLQEREKQLRERLSQQAVKQFGLENKQFENLNLGENRPTELVRQYGNTYSEARVDTLDVLDSYSELEHLSVLKSKILFSIVVLGFRSCQESLQELRGKLQTLLHLPMVDRLDSGDLMSRELRQQIERYLMETADTFDLSENIQEVAKQIFATLFDYPCLKNCQRLVDYIEYCVRLAWKLTTQIPSYVVVYDARTFHSDYHVRFHTSDSNSDEIQGFLWPVLLEGENGPCVSKGVVIT